MPTFSPPYPQPQAARSTAADWPEDYELDRRREHQQEPLERRPYQWDARIKTDALPVNRFIGLEPE